MSAGADYPPPLESGQDQIYGKPLSQSTRHTCYTQQTYEDSAEEGDEYFSLRVATESRTPSNVAIDPTRGTTLIIIADRGSMFLDVNFQH